MEKRVATDAVAIVGQPLGEERYLLAVMDEGMVVDVDVTGVLVEPGPAPTAAIDNDAHVECTSPDGASLLLSAAGSSDPLGRDLVRFEWRLDGADGPLLGTGATLAVFLPFGESVIHLLVENACGVSANTTKTLTVADTTPPTIDSLVYSGPMCLWPPQHDYVIVSVREHFAAVITDVCDPAPFLRVRTATSSQPGDAEGDGATINDVVVAPSHVCVRSERRGGDLDGRVYCVELEAVDFSCNAADPVVEISVGHDQAPSKHCLEDLAPVDDSDPRCSPDQPPPPTEPPCAPPPPVPSGPAVDADSDTESADGVDDFASSANGTASCGQSALPAWSVGAAFAALLRRRRRRAATALVAVPLLLAAAACPRTGASVEYGSLSECLVGVWGARLPLSCTDQCNRDSTRPECGAVDCERRDYVWIRGDGVVVEGFVMNSASRGTFSSSTRPSVDTWSVDGDRARIGPRDALPARCSVEELILDNASLRLRRPEGTEESLAAAFDEQGWRGEPYLR